MFKKPTAFVLGAGASWHYGYPTGEELVRAVAEKSRLLEEYFTNATEFPVGHMPRYVHNKYVALCQINTLAPLNAQRQAWQHAAQDCGHLNQRIRNVDPLVIDYFLGHNAELQPLGKLLITWVLRERETRFRKDGLNINRPHGGHQKGARPLGDNWIRFVIHRLAVGCTDSSNLLDNQVTFVTFNYDMSLEDQIRNALRSNSFFKPAHVNEFLDHSRFLHVYGKIRDISSDFTPLPSLKRSTGYIDPVFAKGFLDDLHTVSSGIRTIDPHEKSDTNLLAQIREVVADARCIYILGFGFDRRNCDRIGLDPANLRATPGNLPKSILFTNFENSNRVNKAASKAFVSYADAFLGEKLAHDSRSTLGNYHEKSIRDCYGALALDFDEVEEN